MNVQAICVASGVLLCAASTLGQTNQHTSQQGRRRIIAGTPEQQAVKKVRDERCLALDTAGFTALHAGQYVEAEQHARQVLVLSSGTDLLAPELLAAALDAQGRTKEAIQAYEIIAERGSDAPRILLPYALLLLKTGQWTQAVAAYNKALPYIAFGRLLAREGDFPVTDSDSTALASAIHVGLGLTYISSADWAGNSRRDDGLAHLQQAITLAPNSPLANYYYGYGLRKLGRWPEARVAFQNAIKQDNGEIKAAAQAALTRLPSPGAK